MPADPQVAIRRAARELLGILAELTDRPTLRVVDADNGLACMILVWNATQMMPTAAVQQRTTGGRAACRSDVLEVIRAAGKALTHRQVVRALREAGKAHGAGTVMKALAELTKSRELVNPKDRRGYRLASWPSPGTPPLF